MSENNNRLDNVRIIVVARERASYWIKDVLQIIRPSDHILIIDSDEPAPPKYERLIKEELIEHNKAAYINVKDIDVEPVKYIEYRLNSEISNLKQSARNISLYILESFYYDELLDSFDGRVRNIGKYLPIEDKSRDNSSRHRQSSDSSNNINNANKKKNVSTGFSDALNDLANDFFDDADTVIDNSEKENKESNNKKKKDNSNLNNQSNKEKSKSDNPTNKKNLSEQGNTFKNEQNKKNIDDNTKDNTKEQDDNNVQNDKKENNKKENDKDNTQQQKTNEEENNNKPQDNDIDDNESLEDTKAKLVLKLYDRLKKNFSKYVDEVSEKEFFNILFLLLKATDYDDFIKSAKTAHPNLKFQPDLGGEDGKIFKSFQAEANYYLKICDDVYKFDVFGDSDEESEKEK